MYVPKGGACQQYKANNETEPDQYQATNSDSAPTDVGEHGTVQSHGQTFSECQTPNIVSSQISQDDECETPQSQQAHSNAMEYKGNDRTTTNNRTNTFEYK